jgi:hypothetical protein
MTSLRHAGIERKNLSGVQQPLLVEHSTNLHLLRKIRITELVPHEITLFEPHTVFPGQASSDFNSEF